MQIHYHGILPEEMVDSGFFGNDYECGPMFEKTNGNESVPMKNGILNTVAQANERNSWVKNKTQCNDAMPRSSSHSSHLR